MSEDKVQNSSDFLKSIDKKVAVGLKNNKYIEIAPYDLLRITNLFQRISYINLGILNVLNENNLIDKYKMDELKSENDLNFSEVEKLIISAMSRYVVGIDE